MKLNIKKTNNDNNNYYYYITFSNEKIESTISFEDVEYFGNDKHELISVHLKFIPNNLTKSLSKLAIKYSEIKISSSEMTINLSTENKTNKTYCVVNFDIDINGEVVGIEII